MLTGITLENFKAFKDRQFIPIKPITLVFGPNSAGKSSIIHALAFLKHVHQTNGNCNPGRMRFGWSELELGPWQNLVFGHDKNAPMKIKLHNETTPNETASIQWCFENTSSGPRVTTFLIEENRKPTAKGENVGIDGIKWKVELHSSHWLWGEFKAALWKKITGRKFERTQTLQEQAETLSRRRTAEASHDLEGAAVPDCGAYQQDVFENHFNLWLGDSWRVPPIHCQPEPGSSNAFEGLFPRRAFSNKFFNEPEGWAQIRDDGPNYALESELEQDF